jgi:hypothetical protein
MLPLNMQRSDQLEASNPALQWQCVRFQIQGTVIYYTRRRKRHPVRRRHRRGKKVESDAALA